MIHKKLLKQLGLHKDVSLSDKIRIGRNRLVLGAASLASTFATVLSRITYSCNHDKNLPGSPLLNEQTLTCPNEVATTAHVNAGITYAFVSKILNRNSIDGAGLTLLSSVNYDKDYNNAFWNGTQMVYGDGDGKFFKDFPHDLSVVAHELCHGVTQTTCNLYYYMQSGALNEAFSDIAGVSCRQWNEGQIDPATANWLIGDKCLGTNFPGKALRSFKDEKAYDGDTQPKHMKNLYWGLQDNGGVHINSGIKNHSFYLICTKLKEPSFGRPIQIVWAAHQTLKSHATFKDAAKAEFKAAKQLYGDAVAAVVKEAYAEVGIKL